MEPLHGLTFALFHLASMRLIGTTVPRNLAATTQALYGTVAIGSSIALLTLASGSLYAWLGGHAFWAMAILCAAATPLAGRMTSYSRTGLAGLSAATRSSSVQKFPASAH